MTTLLLILALSYLLGSIPFSLIVAWFRGVDLRKHGSGNAGATNAVRVLGKWPGLLVFVLDLSKGLVATVLVSQIRLGGEALPGFLGTSPNAMIWMMVFAGTAAILGHVMTLTGYVLFGSFKGGKGVATGAGMLVGLIPTAIGIAIALFVVIVVATRYVSLGSLLATLSIPITLLIETVAFGETFRAGIWAFAIAAPFIIAYTHRKNIRRLLRGTESRV